MQRDAIEFAKWISNLGTRRGQPRVERHALHPRSRNIDAVALLDISKVESVDASALIRHHRRLRVPQQRPGCCAEERMRLDIRRASPRSQPSVFVLDQQFPNQ